MIQSNHFQIIDHFQKVPEYISQILQNLPCAGRQPVWKNLPCPSSDYSDSESVLHLFFPSSPVPACRFRKITQVVCQIRNNIFLRQKDHRAASSFNCSREARASSSGEIPAIPALQSRRGTVAKGLRINQINKNSAMSVIAPNNPGNIFYIRIFNIDNALDIVIILRRIYFSIRNFNGEGICFIHLFSDSYRKRRNHTGAGIETGESSIPGDNWHP